MGKSFTYEMGKSSFNDLNCGFSSMACLSTAGYQKSAPIAFDLFGPSFQLEPVLPRRQGRRAYILQSWFEELNLSIIDKSNKKTRAYHKYMCITWETDSTIDGLTPISSASSIKYQKLGNHDDINFLGHGRFYHLYCLLGFLPPGSL